MANILDYLKWRGDLGFGQDPFNDIDNLILSELAYLDLEGLIGPDFGESVSMEEACLGPRETEQPDQE